MTNGMKLRICTDLHERAKSCAEAIDETLTGFIGLARINDAKGRLDDVAFDEKLMTATRADSVVVTFTGDAGGWACDRVKLALVRAVVFAEGMSKPAAPLDADVMDEIKGVNESSLKLARRMVDLGVVL